MATDNPNAVETSPSSGARVKYMVLIVFVCIYDTIIQYARNYRVDRECKSDAQNRRAETTGISLIISCLYGLS